MAGTGETDSSRSQNYPEKIVWMFHFLDCAALPVPGVFFFGFVAVALFFFAASAILGTHLLLLSFPDSDCITWCEG